MTQSVGVRADVRWQAPMISSINEKELFGAYGRNSTQLVFCP